MADRIVDTTETVTATPGGAARSQTTSTTDTAQPYLTATLIINWVTSVLLALLAIRMVLSLLGANQANAFASFIYTLSYPFVAPFFGLFGYTMEYGVARLELETLVAMLVYALVGYGVARLVNIGRAREA